MRKDQLRSDSKEGGVFHLHPKFLNSNMRNDFYIDNKNIESLSLEILSNKELNTLFNVLYRLPKYQIEPFENHFILQVISTLTCLIMIHIKNLRFCNSDIRKWHDTNNK